MPLLVLLAMLVLPSSRQAHADPILPMMEGPVVDAAGILGADAAQIGAQLTGVKHRSGVELVVVTLPSLQDYAIERWGKALGEAWYVGGKNGLGALLIVAPRERQVRIEVGGALSHLLTDVESSVIIDTRIIPQFRAGKMSAGVLAGVEAMIGEVMPSMAPTAPKVVQSPARETGSAILALVAPVLKWGAILVGHGVVIGLLVAIWRKGRRALAMAPSDRAGFMSGGAVQRRGYNANTGTITFGGSQSGRSVSGRR
jgi:uncharacterized protein